METTGEDVTISGAQRPSESVESRAEVSRSIASFVASRALVIAGSGAGPKVPPSDITGLMKEADRSKMLFDLAAQIRPYGIDPERWLAWLDGSASPLRENTVERPVSETRASSAVLDRRTKQSARIDARLKTARRNAAAAQQVVADIEMEAEEVRATNAAVVEFAIFEQLVDIMNASMAVGPMWALVRAIGAQDPDGEPDKSAMTERQLESNAHVEKERVAESNLIFSTLDFMCGDQLFESRLRGTILRLCERVQDHIKSQAGVKKHRPMRKIKTTMTATSHDEVRYVLGSVPQV